MLTLLRSIAVLAALSNATTVTSGFAAGQDHYWSKRFGDTSVDNVRSVAVVPSNGDVVVTGFFIGTVNLGGGDLTSSGGINQDILVARFDKAGELKWAKRFGESSVDAGVAVAVDATGNVYLTGIVDGNTDFGGGPRISTGGQDYFVAKFDPNGAHVWSQIYGSSSFDDVSDIAVDGSGNVFVTGSFQSVATLGGPNVVSAGSADIYLVKYNSAGVWQWNVTAGSVAYEEGKSVAVDASGSVYATGYFLNTVGFSGTTLVSAGSSDIFLVKYGSGGGLQWSQRRGGTGEDQAWQTAFDPAGHVVVTGYFSGTTNLGGGNLASAGSYDIFLAKYNLSGIHQWSYRFGGPGEDLGVGVAVDANNDVLFCGAYSSPISVGGGNLTHGGLGDFYVARYNSVGQHVSSRGFGGSGNDVGFSIAPDGFGNQIAGGYFESVVNFGGGNLVSAGGSDGFIAKYGAAEPTITNIQDIGNDQGRSVRITLARSPMDDGTASLPISQYQAFRRILPLPENAALKDRVAQVPPGSWEYVASVPANTSSTYHMVAPTLADSTIAQGMYFSVFYVRAATWNPAVFFDSPVDSGYSLDNLAPGVPTNLIYSGGALTWTKPPAADFNYFTVYGSDNPSFGTATLIDYTVAPSLNVGTALYAYYFVTATDFSGNEGNPAQTNVATGAGGTPEHYTLSISAYPNPFNPATTIRYTLPEKSRVTIDVFDARGAIVATLIDTEKPAGAHTIEWNGRDSRDSAVGSGVYFARLSSSSGTRSYKMMLLK